MSESDIAARYVGEGYMLPGVPARDLTAEEWAAAVTKYPELPERGMYEPVPARGRRGALTNAASGRDATVGVTGDGDHD